MNGLYFHNKECGHTYGICAINNENVYDKLLTYFYRNNNGKLYLQSNSMNTSEKDKSYLFVEFIGYDFNENEALDFTNNIAEEINEDLMFE